MMTIDDFLASLEEKVKMTRGQDKPELVCGEYKSVQLIRIRVTRKRYYQQDIIALENCRWCPIEWLAERYDAGSEAGPMLGLTEFDITTIIHAADYSQPGDPEELRIRNRMLEIFWPNDQRSQ